MLELHRWIKLTGIVRLRLAKQMRGSGKHWIPDSDWVKAFAAGGKVAAAMFAEYRHSLEGAMDGLSELSEAELETEAQKLHDYLTARGDVSRIQ